MKTRTKRIIYIILSLISLFCLGCWLFACLFAVGQLYNTYDLWMYMSDAPVAVLIVIVLFAAFAGFLIAAIRTREKK